MDLYIDNNYIHKFGSNYWEIIHLEALKITLDEMKSNKINKEVRDQYAIFFEYIIKNLMCICKNHAYQLFIANKYFDNYKYLFQYTIDFHNEVNRRLKKPIYNYITILEKYKPYIKQNTRLN